MRRKIIRLATLLATALSLFGARADEVTDAFDTVWESLWYQGGSPEPLTRWGGEIRLRIHGHNAAWHRERILGAMSRVTHPSGITFVDITDKPDEAASATLDIEARSAGALSRQDRSADVGVRRR